MWWRSAVLAARLEELQTRLVQAEADRDYWKAKTELLLDQTLFRRGEVAQPIFSKPAKPMTEQTLHNVFGPMAVTEIDGRTNRNADERPAR